MLQLRSNLSVALALFTACVCFCLPRSCHAGSGVTDLKPAITNLAGPRPFSKQTGLRLELDTRWVEGYGYHPLRLKLIANGPVKKDQRIEVEFHGSSWNYNAQAMVVRDTVLLPAGQSKAELTIIAPQLATWNWVWWTVRVNGVLDKSLSRKQSEPLQNAANQTGMLRMLQLELNSGKPRNQQNRPFQGALRIPGNVPLSPNMLGMNQNSVAGIVQVPNMDGMQIDLVEDKLPESLLAYTALDVVLIDFEQLLELAEKSPGRVETLRQWVGMGGSLWIQWTGLEAESLAAINSALRLDKGPQFDLPREKAENLPVPWKWASFVPSRNKDGIDFGEMQRALARGITDFGTTGSPYTSKNWFAEAELGFGHLTAFADQWNDADNRQRKRRAVVNHWRGRNWTERHGLQPDSPNEDFANLFIPDVGQAPVTLFRILITLFVVVAGPLNLWLLVQKQKTYLMILTVPLTAAVLTAGLFAYATLSDGFANRVRGRTLSLLDQKRGEATAWSRLTYYAGFAPREGLVFDDSVAVYPILPGWNEFSQSASMLRERSVRWSDGKQRLDRGWLVSRETTQLLTIESSKCDAAIRFSRQADLLSARNELGADAVLLIVIDDAGEFWMAEAVTGGKRVPLMSITQAKAAGALRSLFAENEPLIPVGLDDDGSTYLQEQRRQIRRQMRRQYNLDYADSTVGMNRMNELLDRLVGADGSPALALPPRSYVAVTEEGVTMHFGLENAQESGSMHVIIGRW